MRHHGELQKKLIRRLRNPAAFQGARLEIVAAASMLPAGYELEFENDKLPGKHAEFVAMHSRTGHKLAVEAKSRHRAGVMGQKGERIIPTRADIVGLLRAAAAKDPVHSRLVFIELNMPISLLDGQPPSTELVTELEVAWKEVQELPWPEGFPAIGVIFYNDASPWFLEAIPPGSCEVFALAMKLVRHRHAFDEASYSRASCGLATSALRSHTNFLSGIDSFRLRMSVMNDQRLSCGGKNGAQTSSRGPGVW